MSIIARAKMIPTAICEHSTTSGQPASNRLQRMVHTRAPGKPKMEAGHTNIQGWTHG